VLFNDTRTTFTLLSSTQNRATVHLGARSGRVSVKTPSGTGVSTGSFTVLVPTSTKSVDESVGEEENSSITLSTASAVAAINALKLSFSGALDVDVDAATDAGLYSVVVNGNAVEVESVQYVRATSSVQIGLPEGTLQAGDEIEVSWNNLRDARGRVLSSRSVSVSAR